MERFLEADLWRHVLAYIEAMPTRTTTQAARRARTRYIFSMLYLLGARVSEFANSTMGAFEVRRLTGGGMSAARVVFPHEFRRIQIR